MPDRQIVKIWVVICTPNFLILAPHLMHYSVVLFTLCALPGCTKWCPYKKKWCANQSPLAIARILGLSNFKKVMDNIKLIHIKGVE